MIPLELKPCPFCGDPAEYDSQRYQGPLRSGFVGVTGHSITCSSCQAEVGIYDTREGAIVAWNRRIPAPPIAELTGKIPLVLYFNNRQDANGFAEAVGKALACPVEIKLP